MEEVKPKKKGKKRGRKPRDPNDLVPNINNNVDKPEDTTWGDYMLRPDQPLADRHRELARLMAHGKTNKEIATTLNYTESRVSVLRTSTKIRSAIDQYRDRLFGADLKTRMKDLAPDALNVMEGILTSPSLDIKDKESAAKWLLEKVTGKAAQQVEHVGDVSIGHFFMELDKIRKHDELNPDSPKLVAGNREVINVEAKKGEEVVSTAAPVDSFDEWLDKNI